MTFVAEVDATGHIAVTEEMRQMLHLVPGSRVTVSPADDAQAEQPRKTEAVESGGDHGEVTFSIENGLPVIDGLEPMSPQELVESIARMRRERMAHIMGPPYTAEDFI